MFFLIGSGDGHIQSLVVAADLLALAGIIIVGGVLANLVSTNRLMLENLLMRSLRAEIKASEHDETLETHADIGARWHRLDRIE